MEVGFNGRPHNFLLSTLPHTVALPVHIVPGEDILAAAHTVFNGFFFLLSTLPHALSDPPILSPAVRKDTLPQALAAFNGTFFQPRDAPLGLRLQAMVRTMSRVRFGQWGSLVTGSRSLMELLCMKVIVAGIPGEGCISAPAFLRRSFVRALIR